MIVILGYGAIGKALVANWHLYFHETERASLLVIDAKIDAVAIGKNLRFLQAKLTPQNYQEILSQNISAGDLLVDASVGIDTSSLIKWAQQNGVIFINSSFELWPGRAHYWNGADAKTISLENRHEVVRAGGQKKPASTAVVLHGMNPGLVSHFTKVALNRLTQHSDAAHQSYAQKAQSLGLKVIHVSEKDTQIATSDSLKSADEFVCTWSCVGIFEEAGEPVQIAWGSHEGAPPVEARLGKHMALFSHPAIDTKMRSFVLQLGEIEGYVMPHSECLTIQKLLTLYEDGQNVLYRPTVCFVYEPCLSAKESFAEIKATGEWKIQKKQRILTQDHIQSGVDAVGVLLVFDGWAFWAGSILSNDFVKGVSPDTKTNATILQVITGIAAAIQWALKNPNEGLCFPEDLPSEEIIEAATPFLGEVLFEKVQWPREAGEHRFTEFKI